MEGDFFAASFADRSLLYQDHAYFWPHEAYWSGYIDPDAGDSFMNHGFSRDRYFSLAGAFAAAVQDKVGPVDMLIPAPYLPIPVERARQRPQHFIPLGQEVKRQDNLVMVFPRHRRAREEFRNWGQPKWVELVEWLLGQGKQVVLSGHPNGACLVEFKPPGVTNIIGAPLEKVVWWLRRVKYAVSQQSGTCSLSLLARCPLLSFGMESIQLRIELWENPLKTLCVHYHEGHDDIPAITAAAVIRAVANFEEGLNG